MYTVIFRELLNSKNGVKILGTGEPLFGGYFNSYFNSEFGVIFTPEKELFLLPVWS